MAEYDLVVIGSGPGGYVAAIRAAQLGLKTACIEKESTLGGTCLNVGCIPSKALLYSSEQYAFMQNHGKEHGIQSSGLKVDFKRMMTRKKEVVTGLVNGIAGLFKRNKVEWIKGTAKFVNPTTIKVGKEEITAKNFILATGSEPIPLPFAPFDEKTVISSTGALGLKEVPKKMLVVGAGVIGVELASVYSRLGSEVVIVEMLDKICPALDATIGKNLQRTLEQQGLTFHLSAKVTGIKGKKVAVEIGKEKKEFAVDAILVAIGRRPYTKELALDKAEIEASENGFIPINNNFQTAQKHIYAIGDLVDGPMLAHKASEEGVAAVELIAGQSTHVNYMAIPNVVYTHPEVACLGFTEAEAKEMDLKIKIGTCSFKGNPRARCTGDTEGLVKIIAEETSGKIIGLHIIGPNASEMIGEGVILIEKQATLEELVRASHAHPTLSESIKEAALQALGRAIHI